MLTQEEIEAVKQGESDVMLIANSRLVPGMGKRR